MLCGNRKKYTATSKLRLSFQLRPNRPRAPGVSSPRKGIGFHYVGAKRGLIRDDLRETEERSEGLVIVSLHFFFFFIVPGH